MSVKYVYCPCSSMYLTSFKRHLLHKISWTNGDYFTASFILILLVFLDSLWYIHTIFNLLAEEWQVSSFLGKDFAFWKLCGLWSILCLMFYALSATNSTKMEKRQAECQCHTGCIELNFTFFCTFKLWISMIHLWKALLKI